jgi:hypothetical protein
MVQSVVKIESAAREVVFESEQMSVWCYPKWRLIYHQMHRYCLGEPFRAGMSAGTQAMQRHRAIAWLSDDRLNGPLPDEDEQWAGTFWFQQTKAAGWKYWAMVLPERAVGKLNVKRYIELSRKRGIEAQMFVAPEPALDWLHGLRHG